MAIYELTSDKFRALKETSFAAMNLSERNDIQRLLRQEIDIVSPDTLIIAEEFSNWDASRRRIDLLGVDRDGNIVVVELKRTEDGGFMDLQSIRYASMIANLQFAQAVAAYGKYLKQIGDDETDPEQDLLSHLGWDEADESKFADQVRIVLVSADFGQELTTSVLWLNERGLDIRCVRLEPYSYDGRVIVDVQQIIPLPEASEYQVKVIDKKRKEREARTSGRDLTKYDIWLGNDTQENLAKRHAIFQLFSYLVGKGEPPRTVAECLGARSKSAVLAVQGTLSAEEFTGPASKSFEARGKVFQPRRYFCKQDELIHYEGETFAFSSQWGGPDWVEAMDELCSKYRNFGISYKPAS